MKKILSLLVIMCIAIGAMAQPPKGNAKKGMTFGQKITADNAEDVNALPAKFDGQASGEANNVKVKGTVSEVCTKEGCWIRLNTNSGKMLVKMRDHNFKVPLSLNGKDVVVEGTAVKKMTSVEELKHYAEDAGKSQAEIDAITEPKTDVFMKADGILVL